LAGTPVHGLGGESRSSLSVLTDLSQVGLRTTGHNPQILQLTFWTSARTCKERMCSHVASWQDFLLVAKWEVRYDRRPSLPCAKFKGETRCTCCHWRI
jgi:hypothetical protein